MKIIKFVLIVLLMTFNSVAQQTPAAAQNRAISIEGATAHLGNGEVIEDALLMFEGGKITFVGSSTMRIARKGTIINAKGRHVYPGFIAPTKALGLIEVDAVRASKDDNEIGEIIPHIRSLIAYNAESKVVESMRPNGVLLGQITPQGGLISGTSSIVQFDAWNWEDAAVKVDDGIHLRWPNSLRAGRTRSGEEPGYKDKYVAQTTAVETFMNDALVYGKGGSEEMNPAFAAMQGVFNGTQRLYVYADDEQGIIDGVSSMKAAGVKHVVLVGGYHAHEVADFLKKNDIPVLVQLTHSLPAFADDDYDFPYKLPKLLMDAGLLVAIQNGDVKNFQSRNLPFYAGQVVGQGMEKEKALQMICSNSAEILGISENYGTLEVGKSATLFISKGDALDMRGNQLTHAYIDGRLISLETHQTELWRRYSEKYKGQIKP